MPTQGQFPYFFLAGTAAERQGGMTAQRHMSLICAVDDACTQDTAEHTTEPPPPVELGEGVVSTV